MPRTTTKEGLINDAKENYEKLNLLISKLLHFINIWYNIYILVISRRYQYV